jgi:hypothetical protein
MKSLAEIYHALMGGQVTFRNASREWLYLGYLLIVCLVACLAVALKA